MQADAVSTNCDATKKPPRSAKGVFVRKKNSEFNTEQVPGR